MSIWKHNEEAIEAVEAFNEKVEDAIGNEDEFSSEYCMTMETNGTQALVKFMGVSIWDSENDEREDEEHSLLEFLEKKAKETLELFSRILKSEGGNDGKEDQEPESTG